MPMPGLEPIRLRPRGGVKEVELFSAPGFTPPASAAAGAKWVFREDAAHYDEELTGKAPETLVRRTLQMTLPATEAARDAVDRLLVRSRQGFVALVTLASDERLTLGYSARFGTAYPLRVVAITSGSGSVPADFPSITLTLECTY